MVAIATKLTRVPEAAVVTLVTKVSCVPWCYSYINVLEVFHSVHISYLFLYCHQSVHVSNFHELAKCKTLLNFLLPSKHVCRCGHLVYCMGSVQGLHIKLIFFNNVSNVCTILHTVHFHVFTPVDLAIHVANTGSGCPQLLHYFSALHKDTYLGYSKQWYQNVILITQWMKSNTIYMILNKHI